MVCSWIKLGEEASELFSFWFTSITVKIYSFWKEQWKCFQTRDPTELIRKCVSPNKSYEHSEIREQLQIYPLFLLLYTFIHPFPSPFFHVLQDKWVEEDEHYDSTSSRLCTLFSPHFVSRSWRVQKSTNCLSIYLFLLPLSRRGEHWSKWRRERFCSETYSMHHKLPWIIWKTLDKRRERRLMSGRQILILT